MREVKLNCPSCGKKVTIGADGDECPKCGQPISAPPGTFGDDDEADQQDVAARLARLVGGHEILAADLPREAEQESAESEPALDELLAEEEDEPQITGSAPEAAEDARRQREEVAESVSDHTQKKTATAGPTSAPQQEWPASTIPRDFDYLLWQTVAAHKDDAAMVARIDIWRRAAQAGCDMWLSLPDGSRVPIPQMILSEAAAAAKQGKTEDGWREGWTRQLLEVAAKWSDDPTKDGVVTTIMHTDAVIGKLREAGVWPWAGGSGRR